MKELAEILVEHSSFDELLEMVKKTLSEYEKNGTKESRSALLSAMALVHMKHHKETE